MSKVPRRFCFTINNFAAYPPAIPTTCNYLVCQKEVGEQGTEHIQGYAELDANINLTTLKRLSPDWHKAHIEPARGTAAQNEAYCSKEGGTEKFTFGEARIGQGQRSDLKELCDYVKEGTHDLRDVVERYPAHFLRHGRHLQALVDIYYKPPRPSNVQENPVWRPWQAEVLALLDQPVSDRHVHFIVDPAGNNGKTFLCRWLAYYRNAYLTGPGDHRYIMHDYKRQPIVVFDCVRNPDGNIPSIPFHAIESFKNGFVQSGLYGKAGFMCDPAHVLVFTNFREINMTALSADRYVMKYIS